MSEMILPGTYIEVRPEGLIVPGRISVNNVGMVGRAAKGPLNLPVLLSTYTEAHEVFGDYDAWDADNPGSELTLVRALEQAFTHGATAVYAVRIGDNADTADLQIDSITGACLTIAAQSPGAWGNEIRVNITDADAHSYISDETHPGGGAVSLDYTTIVESVRNRISVFVDAEQREVAFGIIYNGAPGTGQVLVNTATGALTFEASEAPAAADEVIASYVVNLANSVKVTLQVGTAEEIYIAANGNDLAADINKSSAMAVATAAVNAAELPTKFANAFDFFPLTGGANGAGVSASDYKAGMDQLMSKDAHIIVAAGQDHNSSGADLAAHCKAASSDVNKRERIGIIGSAFTDDFEDVRAHNLNSDRVVFVAPGIEANDAAAEDRVTLPGAYTAAAVAGLLASYSPHISLTNKPIPVAGLQEDYTNAELTQLVSAKVLVLQNKLGFKVVKGITTSSNSAWHQITTRRIVDFAKYGVRSAADPYIGMLNNERVRGAMRATINSFLAEMVEDEMLISYELDVSATREEQRKGIARVTIVLRPVFSIDFIKVTMFLE